MKVNESTNEKQPPALPPGNLRRTRSADRRVLIVVVLTHGRLCGVSVDAQLPAADVPKEKIPACAFRLGSPRA